MNMREILSSNNPVKWLFYGDSITQGSLHTSGYRCYPELFGERVRYELNRPMDTVINTAFSGHTTRDLLETFEGRVKNLNPDFVFIMIGMNDCNKSKGITLEEFGNNLEELLKLVTGISAVPILQTTCPTLDCSGSEDYFSLPEYMEVIRNISQTNNIHLIDHMYYWKKNTEFHAKWMNNLVHPNAFGHRIFAKIIFQDFGIYDDKAPSCKLPLT